MPYIKLLESTIGKLDYCFSLDASCFDYKNLYMTNSYKGEIQLDLSVNILQKQYHSGMGSGIIPEPLRVIFDLLD